ncbi:MAG TPA: 50S ribosomal protein L16 [Candidatus Nanoarchaeia archaeon]|nr:50S ribosomal protein L16 [Candidatus Nanoarchaeia archaeon]
MAKLRQAVAYRRVKRPYTRTSRVKSKSYIKGAPHIKIAQYDMGLEGDYPYEVQVISDRLIQVRDNALEAARQVIARVMESTAKGTWKAKVRVVPHQIYRMNPLATGAGADRFQQGMSQSFGRPEGHAAQVYPGKVLFSIYVTDEKLELAKAAAKKATSKMPMHCLVRVEKKIAA